MFIRRLLKYLLIIVLVVLIFYGWLTWASRKTYPVEWGISFNRQHAESLGLDWQKTYLAMLNDLKPKYLRIAATWSEVETTSSIYKYDDIDWQFKEAEKKGVKIVLVVGQKAPRWPECHVPNWANKLPDNEYRKKLFDYIKTTVDRYKNDPALDIWQVENEPFINFQFGECAHFDKTVIVDEINYVHLLDANHRVLITDSGELSTWKEAIRAGDFFGTTIYRVVRTPQGWIWGYDWLPAAFYRYKAEFWGRDLSSFFVSELQAEPWFNNNTPDTTSISEQEQTMNPERLAKHLDYVQHIGVSRVYLWGVEWWYWMKEKQNDSRYWEIVKKQLTKNN